MKRNALFAAVSNLDEKVCIQNPMFCFSLITEFSFALIGNFSKLLSMQHTFTLSHSNLKTLNEELNDFSLVL